MDAEGAKREAFYDADIAPELAKLAARCREQGLSFVACVGWSRTDTGSTVTTAQIAAPAVRMAKYAALSRGNVDALVFALIEDGRRHGHNSLYLERLGVPVTGA